MTPPHQSPARRFGLPLTLAALAAMGLAGCHHAEDTTPTPVVNVQVAPVTQGPMEHWVRAEALVYPLEQAIITPKISAPVSRFYVNRGSAVHAGQPVAELENRDLIAAQAETESQYQAAEADYRAATTGAIPEDLQKAQLDLAAARKTAAAAQQIYSARQTLYQQGAVPKRDMDQAGVDATEAQNQLELAQQRLAALEKNGNAAALQAAEGELKAAQARAAAAAAEVSYSKISSPIDGVVTDRPVYPGELATTASPLMTIMNTAQVVARAHLPASVAAELKVGDRATLTATGETTPFEGRVTLVSPATDPGSTTVEVWVQAENRGQGLRPGATVAVGVLAATLPAAVTIPAEALLTEPTGETSVMVAGADAKAHQVSVEVGVREPDRVQILKGLNPGQNVISVGGFGLPDNTQIKVVTAAPAGDDDDSGAGGAA